MVLLGCDIGGTFTDCVLHDPTSGRTVTRKVPTTPEDPSEGALEGLRALLAEAGTSPSAVTHVIHGTTTATNAVLTRSGARVALVTNAGFEDVIEIARQNRPRLYDLLADRPAPLVPRESRFGVRGRLDHEGRELEPLRKEDLAAHAEAIAGHDACAVVLLHSYANPAHEQKAAALLARLAPGVSITTSAEVAPEFREYERTATTVMNAYLVPVMARYLERFEAGLREAGVPAPLLVFESAGGVMTPAAARRKPVATVLSGPAGGAAACGAIARATGERRLLGLDMGGTSTDLCVVVDGHVQEVVEGEVDGLPVRTPMLDVTTIGAGGGSIARVDAGGILRVGPASAGASPGPACYGHGGEHPTVTDAHVVLGHLETLVGGTFRLDAAAGRRAVETHVAKPLGLDVEEAAEAILRVADANILGAARVATASHGHDPREFLLCTFGGAGPLHAAAVARGLGVRAVLVPPASGVLSAMGFLVADLRRDGARAWMKATTDGAASALEALGQQVAAGLAADAVGEGSMMVRYAVDARYVGQAHELTLPLTTPADVERAADAFHGAHAALFGHHDAEAEVQLVNLRATVLRKLPAIAALPGRGAGETAPPKAALRGERAWGGPAKAVARVWDREALLAGNRIDGPAIVEEAGSTLLVPAGARATLDRWGNIRMEVEA